MQKEMENHIRSTVVVGVGAAAAAAAMVAPVGTVVAVLLMMKLMVIGVPAESVWQCPRVQQVHGPLAWIRARERRPACKI